MTVFQYISGIITALFIGHAAVLVYLHWRDRHIPTAILQHMRPPTALPQTVFCGVALIVIVPFSTRIPMIIHLFMAYLIAGLLIVLRDLVKPVYEQPKYAKDFNIRKQKGGLILYCAFWPLFLFTKVIAMFMIMKMRRR